ncbi:MAG TPA: hypothetical protein VLC93_04280, partial [Myxococcota bacterium]|nr:hypothetical protein [Myxococcota bacterium]
MMSVIAPSKLFNLDLPVAVVEHVAQLPAVVPPERTPASTVALLQAAEAHDVAMYGAVRRRGENTSDTLVGKLNDVFPLVGAGVAFAGGIASACALGWQYPGPFFIGLIASAATLAPLSVHALGSIQKRRAHDPLPTKCADRLVRDFEEGDPATQRLMVSLASRWHDIAAARVVAGIEARHQLKALADVKLPLDAVATKRVDTAMAILQCLRQGNGAPRKELDATVLTNLKARVEGLTGDDRAEVATYLRERLYRDERPRFKTERLRESSALFEALCKVQAAAR